MQGKAPGRRVAVAETGTQVAVIEVVRVAEKAVGEGREEAEKAEKTETG